MIADRGINFKPKNKEKDAVQIQVCCDYDIRSEKLNPGLNKKNLSVLDKNS